MKRYGQFCPVAKAAEILGNAWSILIIRELLLGSNRFSMLQKGLPRISPTVLNKRLGELEENGVIIKRRISGQRGHEYRLTAAGKELSSLIEAYAIWGMRWARDEMDDDDMDITFLMFDVQRNIVHDELPDGENILCFQYPDLSEFGSWWLVCHNGEVDLCYENPGKEVNAYITANSKDMIGIWMGDIDFSNALVSGKVTLLGDATLCRRFRKWFPLSAAAGVARPDISSPLHRTI